MATIEDFYPKKFLSTPDLGGEDMLLTINEVGKDHFEDDDGVRKLKPILYFREPNVKPMILNKTNFVRLVEIAGEDTEDWHGTKIILYPDKVSMKGKTVDTIRVRKASKPKVLEDVPFDDAVELK
jgi:hypothetical protein